MTTEQAINEIVSSGYGQVQCHEETMRMAVDALRAQQARENQKPQWSGVSKEVYQMMCEERDAAVNALSLTNTRKFNTPCEICKHNGEKCEPVDLQSVCCKWEWRGVQKDK